LGAFKAAFTAAFSWRTTAGGVPAGAYTAIQEYDSKPGTAVEATVGIWGASAVRLAPVTASVRKRPVFICGNTTGMLAKTK